MPERFAALVGALGIVVGGTALVGGFSGPDGWKAMVFCGLAVVGAIGLEVWFRRQTRAAPAPPVADDPDQSSYDLMLEPLPPVKPVAVTPPATGPHLGVAVGLSVEGALDAILPMGAKVPAKGMATVPVRRPGRLQVALFTASSAEARPRPLTKIQVVGAADDVRSVKVVLKVDDWGNLKAVAATDDGTRLVVELEEGGVSLPIARS